MKKIFKILIQRRRKKFLVPTKRIQELNTKMEIKQKY